MISFIQIAHAAADNKAQIAAKEMVAKINDAILFPLIALMMALAFLIFLYGAFEFVKNANNQTARETGRRHLMYGVIGMFVMLSAFAILNIAAGTFGLQKELKNAHDPVTNLAPSASRSPTARPDFNPAGYADDSTYWSGDSADSFGGDSGYIRPDDIPPEIPDISYLDGLGVSPSDEYTLPHISQGSDEFVFSARPSKPLSPSERDLVSQYVDRYSIENISGRTDALNNQDEQALLDEYQKFGITEVVFMIDANSTYGTRQGAGALSQQEYLCQRMGGELTLESGTSRVTSRSMYACLR